MRRRLGTIVLALLLTACASGPGDFVIPPPAGPPAGAILFDGPDDQRFYWDLRDRNLSLARADSYYPRVPETDLTFYCPSSGQVTIDMGGSRVATDVGGVLKPTKLGLAGGSVSIMAAPTWRYTGFEGYPSLTISMTAAQPLSLLTAADLAIRTQYGDGGEVDTVEERYAPPPVGMVERFLIDCASPPSGR